MDVLRVLTFNVRRFKGIDGESSVAAIGDALAGLQPHLVALNEVDIQLWPQALPSLAERLGGFQVAFFGHVAGRYGNALLSRHPIKAVRETHLRGGTEVAFPAGMKKHNGEIAREGERHRIARGLLECDIEIPGSGAGPGTVITAAVTHLDHMSEEQRAVQLGHVMEALGPNSGRALLLGDLNALTRSDYTDAEWAALEERAAARQWAPPTPSGGLEVLTRAGFADAFLQSRGGGPLSEGAARRGGQRPVLGGATAGAGGPGGGGGAEGGEVLPPGAGAPAPPEEGSIFTAHVGQPLYRIDYCFVAQQLGLAPLAAAVRADVRLSDHYPVVFDFHVPRARL